MGVELRHTLPLHLQCPSTQNEITVSFATNASFHLLYCRPCSEVTYNINMKAIVIITSRAARASNCTLLLFRDLPIRHTPSL